MKESKESKSCNPPLPPSPRTSQINQKNCGIFSIRCDRHVYFSTAWSFPEAKIEHMEKLARGCHAHKGLQKSFFRYGIPMLEFRIEQRINPSHMGGTVLPLKQFKHTIGIASLVKVIGKFPTRRWYKLACWVKWMKDL